MKVKVQVEEFTFNISVGQGYNDIAWLSLAACKLYGKKKVPQGNYLPSFIKIAQRDEIPHPRTKIIDLFQKLQYEQYNLDEIEFIVSVKTQQSNKKINNYDKTHQQEFFNQAFGKQRNFMKYKLFWNPEKIPDQKNKSYFAIVLKYKMFQDVQHEFHMNDYKQEIEERFDEKELSDKFIEYSLEIELPFGELTPVCIRRYWEQDSEMQCKEINLNQIQFDEKSNVYYEPIPKSQTECWVKLKEYIKEKHDRLNRESQEKENQQKQNLNQGLCPFNFENVWNLIENNQDGDPNLNVDHPMPDNIKALASNSLTKNLDKIYEVFYQYTFVSSQTFDKKEDIVMTWQDVMHFLKFYGICQDSQQMFKFLEFYDVEQEKTKNYQFTLNLEKGVKFQEFIVIFLKAVYFNQLHNPEIDETTDFEYLLNFFVEKLIKSDEQLDLNEFQKHLKYNMTVIDFIRENSDNLQSIFLGKLQDSMQLAEKKFHLLTEEIKSIILEAGYKDENLDDLINLCYQELKLDVYQGYEGIFYYDYLQIMCWLSLMLVTNRPESGQDAKDKLQLQQQVNQEQPIINEEDIDSLIEKFKYLLENIKLQKF